MDHPGFGVVVTDLKGAAAALERTAAVLANKGAAAASTLCSAMAIAVTRPNADRVLRSLRRSLLQAMVAKDEEYQALDSAFRKIIENATNKPCQGMGRLWRLG